MTQRRDVDRLLSTWSEDAYSPPPPAYLTEVLERTRRTRQRRAWASLERWLPVSLTTDRPAAPRALRLVWILLIIVVLLILSAGIAVVGGRLLAPTPALPLAGAAVLAFASQEGGATGAPVGDLYTVRADGADLRQLTSDADAGDLNAAPVWSPDGTRIAFRSYHERHNSVEVMDAAGANRTTLWTSSAPRDPFCAEHDDLAWSPDGQTVAFAAHEACPDDPNLFVVPGDGSSAGSQAPHSRHARGVPEVLGRRPADRLPWQRGWGRQRPLRSPAGIGWRRRGRPSGPSDRSRSRRPAWGDVVSAAVVP